MDFFEKYFKEAIITALIMLGIVFVFGCLTLNLMRHGEIITEKDLRIEPMGENYTRIFDESGNEIVREGKKPRYSVKEYFENEKLWIIPERNPDSIVFMVPYKAARCKVCKKVIPIAAFKRRECPVCKKIPY